MFQYETYFFWGFMILPAYGLLILVSLAPLHFFASFSSSVGQDSYIYGLMVALVGGYGNTVPALATLLVGLIGMGRLSIKGDSGMAAFLSGKILGIITTLLILIAVLGHGAQAYLKFSAPSQQALQTLVSGPGFIHIILIVLALATFFMKKK